MGICFVAEGLAKDYPEANRLWAILSLSLKGIKGERREKEGASLSPQTWKEARKEMAESTFFSPIFLVEKKVR